MERRLWLTLLLATLLTSCALEDDREECCEQAILYFHETIAGTDRFEQDIHSLRHFVFDDKGNYIQEIMSNPKNIREVSLSGFDYGRYTMITVANSSERTRFEGLDCLRSFMLCLSDAARSRQQTDDTAYGNADELYWNRTVFTVDGENKTYYCPLSNLHCHLHVTASWKGVPRQRGLWTMRLYDVSTGYELGSVGLRIDEWEHPRQTGQFGDHRAVCSVFNFELDASFVTCRWSNRHVPTLQIWCGDEPVTRPMDLEKAFAEWGWYPDRTLVQEYWLELLIGDDGSVEMRQGGQANVHDWIDGGTISN